MTGHQDLDARLRELRDQLLRYRADRHPLEHAMLQFHLGTTLLQAGQLEPAERALRVAAELFDPDDHPVEHAKSTNMLGVALRDAGRPDAAREAFNDAAERFARAELPLEEGAARHNVGLVLRDRGHDDAAVGSFERAWELLRGGPPGQAAAAARELGAALLQTGRHEDAVVVLAEAIELASKAGDRPGMGAAANALGLAHLADDAHEEAVEAFRTALACHPRRVRPEAYAMAKANLALAFERLDDPVPARLAARQARRTPAAPAPVVGQATAVLERLGDPDDDLMVALDRTEEGAWAGEIRDELLRWLDVDADERRATCGAWVDGQVARDARGIELAAAYLDVILELPPEAMETLIRATLEALQDRDPEVREAFRRHVSRAMARFNVPQWMRLKDTFNRLAEDVGDDGSWG